MRTRWSSFGSLSAFLAGVFLCQFAAAQQNLFNVPNGEITDVGELFWQQQFNFSSDIGTSNTTIDFGVGHGWEVGINLLDLHMYDTIDTSPATDQQQVDPDVLFNAQKGFELTEHWKIGLGGQFGFNPTTRHQPVDFLNFTWIINEMSFPERAAWGRYYSGAYYANPPYSGPGDSYGLLLGFDVPVIPDRLSFQADWTTGHNDLGVIVIGGVYTFENSWQLSMGAQLPSPGTDNPYGVVVEITQPGAKLAKPCQAAWNRLIHLQ